MNKKLFFGLIPVVLLITATAVIAHDAANPLTIDLLAGKTIKAGDVKVWNDADYLYVKYDTDDDFGDDWYLIETHLAVACSLEGIPQNSKGNPVPGHFPYKEDHDSVTEYTYMIDLDDIGCDRIYIAPHAVVRNSCFEEETAWSHCTCGCYCFPGYRWPWGHEGAGRWGEYFIYELQ